MDRAAREHERNGHRRGLIDKPELSTGPRKRSTMNDLKGRLDPETYTAIATWANARQGDRIHLAYDSEGGCFNASHEGELEVTFPGPDRVALTLIAGPWDACETTTRCYPASDESDGREYEVEVLDDTLYVYTPGGGGAYSAGSEPRPPRADWMPF